MAALVTMKTEVESSNLKSLTTIPSEKILIVEFKNKTAYMYTGVDSSLYDQVVAAESVGKEFNKLIKGGGFPYLKL